jgi:hypothetical protein
MLHSLQMLFLYRDHGNKSLDGADNETRGCPPSAFCCVPLRPLLPYVNWPKAVVACGNNQLVINTNIRVNIMAARRERNIGEYAGGGSVASLAGYGGGQCMGHLSVDSEYIKLNA